jgi:hypothetical protein
VLVGALALAPGEAVRYLKSEVDRR